MVATKDSAVQPIAVGFQCCVCCGPPGRKRPTCSCHKKTGKIHQCLKLYQKEQEKQAEQEKLAQKGQEKQAKLKDELAEYLEACGGSASMVDVDGVPSTQ